MSFISFSVSFSLFVSIVSHLKFSKGLLFILSPYGAQNETYIED